MQNIDPVWPERETISVHIECQKRIRELEAINENLTKSHWQERTLLEQENAALKSARSLHGIGSVKQLMDANSELIASNVRLEQENAALKAKVEMYEKDVDPELTRQENENLRLIAKLERAERANKELCAAGGVIIHSQEWRLHIRKALDAAYSYYKESK